MPYRSTVCVCLEVRGIPLGRTGLLSNLKHTCGFSSLKMYQLTNELVQYDMKETGRPLFCIRDACWSFIEHNRLTHIEKRLTDTWKLDLLQQKKERRSTCPVLKRLPPPRQSPDPWTPAVRDTRHAPRRFQTSETPAGYPTWNTTASWRLVYRWSPCSN